MQEASVIDWPAQPVTGRHPALPEGLPAVGGALPGHRPQLHVWLHSGAEWRWLLPGPGWSASRHAWWAAPLPHQENQQVLLSGLDQRRGPRVCGVKEAETRRPQGDLFTPPCQMRRCFSPQGMRQERSTRGVVSVLATSRRDEETGNKIAVPSVTTQNVEGMISEQTRRIVAEMGFLRMNTGLQRTKESVPSSMKKKIYTNDSSKLISRSTHSVCLL